MEDVLKKCNELYDELIKEKKDVADVRFQQGETAAKLSEQEREQTEEAAKLKSRGEILKVYEDVEACEKANKTEELRLKAESDRIAKENYALNEARLKLQREIKDKELVVATAKERYEAELAAVKKTQAELKVKQDKVDKFLAQVK